MARRVPDRAAARRHCRSIRPVIDEGSAGRAGAGHLALCCERRTFANVQGALQESGSAGIRGVQRLKTLHRIRAVSERAACEDHVGREPVGAGERQTHVSPIFGRRGGGVGERRSLPPAEVELRDGEFLSRDRATAAWPCRRAAVQAGSARRPPPWSRHGTGRSSPRSAAPAVRWSPHRRSRGRTRS